MANKWVNANDQYVQGGLLSDNELLVGDYPNIKFQFDLCAQWWSTYKHSQYYNGVNFKFWVTYYNTYWTTIANVSYAVDSGYSPKYAKSTWYAPMGDNQQITQDCYIYVSNCLYPYDSGKLTLTSPKIERPTNLHFEISEITENSCRITYSFTNKRKYWRLKLWNATIKKSESGYLEAESGSFIVNDLWPNTEYSFELWAYDRKDAAIDDGTVYKAPVFKTLEDQATLFTKTNDTWQKGKLFVKKEGIWHKAKSVYVKQNGVWHKASI